MESLESFKSKNLVHIRLVPAGKRKITTIEGLDESIDLKSLAQRMRHKFACIGTVKNKGIRLSGDQRLACEELLIDEGLVEKENVRIHGE